MDQQFCVYVDLSAQPGKSDSLLEALQSLSRASLATDFCTQFDVVQSAEDPDRFILFEVFSSAEIYPTHVATEHAQWFLNEVIPQYVAQRAVTYMKKTSLTT